MAKVTFPRTKPRLWQGNGFGYSPAEYAVRVNGLDKGTLTANITYGWVARDRSGAVLAKHDKIADCKAAVVRHFNPPGAR